MKIFLIIMLIIYCIIVYGFVSDYNKLVNKYNEQQKLLIYYKQLFERTLAIKRQQEAFIDKLTKTYNIKYENRE